MKARVKATGKIVEVTQGIYSPHQYVDKEGTIYTEDQLEELSEGDGVIFFDPTIDYWTRLEHTYAGMAMQGLLQSPHLNIMQEEPLVGMASSIAHALVEKIKEERK